MFKFHEPGKFQRLAQTMRAKAQLERLQGEIASTARKTGISSATKLALIAPSKEVYEDRVPNVEWWDAAILPTGKCVPVCVCVCGGGGAGGRVWHTRG